MIRTLSGHKPKAWRGLNMNTSVPSRERAVNLWKAVLTGDLELSDLTLWEKAAVIEYLEEMLG